MHISAQMLAHYFCSQYYVSSDFWIHIFVYDHRQYAVPCTLQLRMARDYRRNLVCITDHELQRNAVHAWNGSYS